MALVTYTIPLAGNLPGDLGALGALIDTHAEYFDRYILAAYGDDSAYSVVPGSFMACVKPNQRVEYSAQVHYFAPCRDIDRQDQVSGAFSYQIINEQMQITLDETPWIVD